jgi:hypothetical protein
VSGYVLKSPRGGLLSEGRLGTAGKIDRFAVQIFTLDRIEKKLDEALKLLTNFQGPGGCILSEGEGEKAQASCPTISL